ncbi:MAG: PqqD family protein [FCB group bacterium]|jgi:hypothetical protein
MKLKKNIAASETGFIFNPSTGDSFSTNEIGSEILMLMKENKSNSDIENYILDKYDIDSVTFERDYEDFISLLQNHNLLDS